MIQILKPERIAAARRTDAQAIAIEVIQKTGSTNADLMQRIDALSSPVLLIALEQTAGRGRNGRVWHSAPGASLTFSLAWKFSRTAQEMAGLPLAVGVAMARALGKFGVMTRLKWPNDVMKNGKKLAGILMETSAAARNDAGYGRWVVIGIGINLTLPDSLEARIGQPAGDAPWLAQLDHNQLMAAILDALSDTMSVFDMEGFAPFMQQWNALHLHAGQEVTIIDRGQGLHNGIAAGIDSYGRLLLDSVAGRIAISAGDVSLRAISGQEHAIVD